jgi:FAD dependent oxidoreductase TIGR03364
MILSQSCAIPVPRLTRISTHAIVSTTTLPGTFDLAVVGAGILGLSCARAAVLRGLRVIVIDRDGQANGASVRNFGFITVTGQQRGGTWQRARRSCAIWREMARDAGIPILQEGMWLLSRRREATALLEAFLATEMGAGCRILSPAAARTLCSHLGGTDLQAVLHSSIECRVDSRQAIPRIAAWLAAQGVRFLRHTTVLETEPPRIRTSRGVVDAGAVAVCPGDDLTGLYPQRIESYGVQRCKLQMLRLADPGFRLPAALMSDLGLVRYAGYGALPQAAPLRAALAAEQPDHVRHGVHLIVVQDGDGGLVVGDSHDYGATPDPFGRHCVDELILAEYAAALGIEPPRVLERWIGTYSSAADRTMFIDAPAPGVRLAMVTGGSGASTGFAIGEEVIDKLFSGRS